MKDKYEHKYPSKVVFFIQEKKETVNELCNSINSFLNDMDIIDIKFAVDDKKWQAMIWHWPKEASHKVGEEGCICHAS